MKPAAPNRSVVLLAFPIEHRDFEDGMPIRAEKRDIEYGDTIHTVLSVLGLLGKLPGIESHRGRFPFISARKKS